MWKSGIISLKPMILIKYRVFGKDYDVIKYEIEFRRSSVKNDFYPTVLFKGMYLLSVSWIVYLNLIIYLTYCNLYRNHKIRFMYAF